MTRYAKPPSPRGRRGGWLRSAISSAGAGVARNPVAVGGTTAFLVSLAFISANAVFYQPQVHPSAFLSTRVLASGLARAELPAEATPRPAPREERAAAPEQEQSSAEPAPESTGSVPEAGGDATVRAVQSVLSDLSLYRGPIDGLPGPQTSAAITTYRRIVGLEPNGDIDAALLQQLGLAGSATQAKASTASESRPQATQVSTGEVQTASVEAGDALVRRVQAGLKAFGNDAVETDGVMGTRTREALREFQSLFGLPVTGEPDEASVAKMREIGLIN